MEMIYLVKRYGGEYDGAWEENLFAVRTEEEAKLEVTRHELAHLEASQLSEKLKEVWHTYLADHSNMNEFEFEQTLPMPVRERGKKGDKKVFDRAFAAACQEWTKNNQPILQRNQERQRAYELKGFEQVRKAALELKASEDCLKMLSLDDLEKFSPYSFNSDTGFTYETLELK